MFIAIKILLSFTFIDFQSGQVSPGNSSWACCWTRLLYGMDYRQTEKSWIWIDEREWL